MHKYFNQSRFLLFGLVFALMKLLCKLLCSPCISTFVWLITYLHFLTSNPQNPMYPWYGSKGRMIDLRPVLNQTASRLLHIKHPKLVTEYAKLQSLQNAVHMLPGKSQKQSNRMGDSFSKQTAKKLLEKVCEDYDEPVWKMKTEVEGLYMGSMANASYKSRRALANKLGITGYSFFADNVGRVSVMVLPMQVCKYAGVQACRYTGVQVCRCIGLQVLQGCRCKVYTCVQCSCVNVLLCVGKCATVQVCKYASVHCKHPFTDDSFKIQHWPD